MEVKSYSAEYLHIFSLLSSSSRQYQAELTEKKWSVSKYHVKHACETKCQQKKCAILIDDQITCVNNQLSSSSPLPLLHSSSELTDAKNCAL